MSDREVIEAAVDAAFEAWKEDPTVLFGSESERRKGLYGSRSRRLKAWRRPGPCMYRGCTNTSIIKSHAVQRSKVLAALAEDGHLLTPGLTHEGEVVLERVGVGEASTFPGFCEEHEGLFGEFEAEGQITNERHSVLQILRTVCREIALREFQIREGTKDLEDYRQARRDYFERAVAAVLPDAEMRGMQVKGDPREDWGVEVLSRTQEVVWELESLYEAFTNSAEGRKGRAESWACRLPVNLPLALSGIVLVDYRKRSERVRVAPLALGVIPQAGGSLVFVGTLTQHRAFIAPWIARLEKGLTGLSLVEGWMVHGTDHWFIPPSLWNGLAAERKERILSDLASTEGVPGSTPAPGIFDDLRRFFLNSARLQLAGGASPPFLGQLIEEEDKKLPATHDA